MAHFAINCFSDFLQMSVNLNVILPQRTIRHGFTGSTPDGKFPVLYLLHGMGDDQTIWQRRTAIERYVEGTSLAVVMPTTHLGFYTDMQHGLPYWSFFSQELPALCRQFFPQLTDRREYTFAAGNSMGGYGAVKLALGMPDQFGKAVSLSGALDLVGMAKHTPATPLMQNIFGSTEQLTGSDNDLLALAEKTCKTHTNLPKLRICCGTEDPLLPFSRSAKARLIQLGYDVTYQESPGVHDWAYWDTQIRQAIPWLLEGMEM
ncbi:alpha/beta hydrolase family protein [Ruminococcus champanellensis]|uniref:alpha/beta hydrolase n=1 Tax=Ruminococcus champanellensis TaxID=1161942 RepID=UPI002E793D8B|nr:alpha/beta hydrolase family protein [Ruminococcus champanellensis]MED9892447.1 alpha/beta hydrolase family protein [Ruminococcus champanellensis]